MVTQATATYAEMCTWENLYSAYRRAARGKRSHQAAAGFEFRLEDNLLELQVELLEHRYRPGRYASFTIHEPKRRLISAAPFRDRVVHHALCQLIEPAFERSFIEHSYANRAGKGTHRALDTCQRWAARYRYALGCDIRQFFPSIDHSLLQRTLNRRIQDGDLRRLIGIILESGVGVLSEDYNMGYFPGDNPSTGSGQGLFAANRPRGLPIGNLTSQFWANCYISSFDHFVNRELGCPAYLRYFESRCSRLPVSTRQPKLEAVEAYTKGACALPGFGLRPVWRRPIPFRTAANMFKPPADGLGRTTPAGPGKRRQHAIL